MNILKPNNLPLPNVLIGKKLLYTSLLIAGLGLFSFAWISALITIYNTGWTEDFGAELGYRFSTDMGIFWRLFWLHVTGLILLGAASFSLVRMTALRKRVKQILLYAAILFGALDLYAWHRAPTCSSTNSVVGYLGLLAGVPLALLAIVPLWQLWVYKRWHKPSHERKRVLVVGGGFAGLYAALGLNKIFGYHPDLDIVVLDRKNYFLFPPLLPSAAAGTIETRQVSYPFRRIFETTNIVFRKVEVTSIDPKSQVLRGRVEVNTDPSTGQSISRNVEYAFDYLVLAPGSTTQTFGTTGVDQHAYFMRELNDAVILRNHVIDCFERAAVLDDEADRRELLRFVVVGAGPTGIETATEIYDLIHAVLLKRYPEIRKDIPSVVLVQSGKQILPGWDASVVAITEKQLNHMGIEVLLGARVSAVGAHSVSIGTEMQYQTRTVVWCAGVKASPLLAQSGLPIDTSGRIPIQNDLSVAGYPGVFVLGDAAYLVNEKDGEVLPPLGQVAFQPGSHAAKNIARMLAGKQTKKFSYFNFGGLVSVGEHFAAVNLMGVRLSGFIGWIVWRSLYLAKLVGVSNKIRVMIDWTLDLLIERSISQIRDSHKEQNVESVPQKATA